MSGINTGKVITGGLVAAVVFFIIDFLTNGVLMKADLDANAARLGLDAAAMMSSAAMVMWAVTEVVFGVLVVWTYAAIRPRFGPGVGTAVKAGLIPYIAVLLMMLGLAQGGLMTMSIFWKMSVFALISILAGSIAGAYFYKEA